MFTGLTKFAKRQKFGLKEAQCQGSERLDRTGLGVETSQRYNRFCSQLPRSAVAVVASEVCSYRLGQQGTRKEG